MTRPSRPPSPAARSQPPARRRIHRFLAIPTGTLLLYLIATGLPLQLTTLLNLAGSYVSSPFILDWYGIRAPGAGWRSGDAVLLGRGLYWNSAPVAEVDGLRGAVRFDQLAVVAAPGKLLVFPRQEPALLETIPLAGTIERIGTTPDEIILETDAGLLAMDATLLNPDPTDTAAGTITWARLEPLGSQELADYQRLSRARILTRERFLQDLHSGRILGGLGEWLVNLASLAMAVLAFTGMWIWWRSR